MRVDGPRPLRPATVRKDSKSAAGSVGGFAEALGAEAPTSTSPASPASTIGALFALQEVPDATAERRKAVARADHILDRLGEIQLGLLEGKLDRHSLADLAATARTARAQTGDPRLQGVLDEIELRAAVELAKLST
jgi:hypothetical protein